MTALYQPSRRSTNPLPRELSPTGKLVYLYLDGCGRSRVEDIKATLGVPQIRLYPVLEALERRDLIDRSGDEVALRR